MFVQAAENRLCRLLEWMEEAELGAGFQPRTLNRRDKYSAQGH